MKINFILCFACLFATLAQGAITSAQSEVIRAWNDGDYTNDPNTCHEPGSDCKTWEDWQAGWCQARSQAGLQCGQQDNRQPAQPIERRSSSSSSSGGGGGSSSSSGGGGGSSSSSGGGGSSPSSSGGGSAQPQTQTYQSSQATSARYRYYRDTANSRCPAGKACVSYWPSGDYYVFNVGANCCYPNQAIDKGNVFERD